VDNSERSINMPKISERLESIRNLIIWDLHQQQETEKDIGTILNMSTAQIYNIINKLNNQPKAEEGK